MRRSLIAWTLAAAFAASTLSPAAAEQPPPQVSFGEMLAPEASGRRPTLAAWSPDGKRLGYVWEKALWVLDPATGKSEAVWKQKDAKDGETGTQESEEIASYVWSPDGGSLLLALGGDLYLQSLGGREIRRLTHTAAAEEDPRFSPDGRRIAFVRGFDLYVLDTERGDETRLTSDGEESVSLNGTTDWVYGEEIWDRTPEGFWWSPDSSRIAFYHFDETPVGVYPLVDDTPLYPKVTLQKYPKAGEPNPRVKVGVVNVATRGTTWLKTGETDSYLARVDWTPAGDAVAVQRLNRDQTQLDLLRCGATDGACTPLVSEAWRTWINLGRDFRFLPDGRFLWGSERDGWRRLYLFGADGHLLRPATPAGWAVTSLDAVATDGSWAVVTAFPTSGLGPIDRRVARVDLSGD